MSTIHHVRSKHFDSDSRKALKDVELRGAIARVQNLSNTRRDEATEALPNWQEMREQARIVKTWTIERLGDELERFERNATARGTQVHWARDAMSACEIVRDIAKAQDARTVVKSKSMLTEEIGLNAVLESAGMEVVETDLGEWIVQLAGDPPAHIVLPAIHLTRQAIHRLFEEKLQRKLESDAESLTMVAREVLRSAFLRAEVGVTGVNYLVAETGSFLVLENEGNQRLTTSLPRVHIAVAGIEKLVPRLQDLDLFLRMIARTGTGQIVTTYQNLFTGPKHSGSDDGPQEIHVVLVDNGRSALLGSRVRRQTLLCIRCGACLNTCPVYRQIGGHAYGSVYPGPIGSIFTPQIAGMHEASQLPYASSLCGACRDVCPVKIDIPEVLLELRAEIVENSSTGRDRTTSLKIRREHVPFRMWAWLMCSPRRYAIAGVFARVTAKIASRTRMFDFFLPPLAAWRKVRSVPRPEGGSFRARWRERKGRA